MIIDDIGYSISRARAFLSLNMPMTFSILPQLRHSNRLADEITGKGHEVMLHQPMEPYCNEIHPGAGSRLHFIRKSQNRRNHRREPVANSPGNGGEQPHGLKIYILLQQGRPGAEDNQKKGPFFCGQLDEQAFTGIQNGPTAEHENRTEKCLPGPYPGYSGGPPPAHTLKATRPETWGCHRHRTSASFHADGAPEFQTGTGSKGTLVGTGFNIQFALA